MNRKPRILVFDIETSPLKVYSWRVGSKINISHDNIIEEAKIICVCYKYLGDKKGRSLTWDQDQCDKTMLSEFGKIMQEADVVVGQNSDNFDIKWVKDRLVYHRLPPVTNLTTIDTLKLARSNFRFTSNKLDYVGKYLNGHGKLKTDFDLWKRVMAGEKKALKEMVEYCMVDVSRTEEYLDTILPYVDRLPFSLSVLINNDRDGCPKCGSKPEMQIKHSTRPTLAGLKQRYQCKSCGSVWTDSRAVKKEI